MAYAPHHARLATPIGTVTVEGDSGAVTRIAILAEKCGESRIEAPPTSPVAMAAEQLHAYFAGECQAFDLPLVALSSARGEALRAAIASVPYGETLTYGTLAKAHDSGARAVGGACAHNPYPIVIPCHRVTSSGGAKENYSAGEGPVTKAWLIAHEARHSGKALL